MANDPRAGADARSILPDYICFLPMSNRFTALVLPTSIPANHMDGRSPARQNTSGATRAGRCPAYIRSTRTREHKCKLANLPHPLEERKQHKVSFFITQFVCVFFCLFHLFPASHGLHGGYTLVLTLHGRTERVASTLDTAVLRRFRESIPAAASLVVKMEYGVL